MNALLNTAEWWTRTLWALSWQIGVLVGVVWLASLVFRRASPNFRYWLWCIVLVRLCIPVSLALPAGVSGDVRHALETSAPAVLLTTQRAVMPPAAPPAEMGDLIPEAAAQGLELSLNVKLAFGWTAVSLCLLIVVVMKSLRVRRMLQGWREVTRPELLLLVDSLRSKFAIGGEVRVRILPAAQSAQGPAVVGIMRPTILLPAPVAEQWSLDDLEPVLLHELAHVKRWDLLVNVVQIVVQAVYFFHPLVWLVNARIRQERELVCDDLAVLHSGGRCKRYSQSFMRVLEETSNAAPLLGVAGVGMTERRKPLARRIIRMMSKDYRLHRPMGWLSIALLVIVSAAAIAVAAERAADVIPQDEVELNGYVRPTGNASVSGKVVDADTGEPIDGSSVMLFRTDTMDAILVKVAGDGSFEFKDVAGGAYMLRMNAAPDHVTGSANSGGVTFQLGEEEQKRDIVFSLRRGFSIAGRVTIEDGSPLPEDKACGVVAWAEMPSENGSGSPRFKMVGQSQVDAKDGAYRIGGLDGTPVYVQFMDGRSELKDDPYPPMYFPGTFSRDKATLIAFDTNGETEIKNVDIPLRKTGGLVLEGTVSNRGTGAPIPKTLVVVCHQDTTFDRATTYTDAQGRYRFECLGAGEFQLVADATPGGYVRTRKLVALSDAAPVTRLDLTLTTGATISGVFVQEDGTPWPVQKTKVGIVQIRGAKDVVTQYSGAWNRYAPGRPQFGGNVYSPGEGDYETAWMGFPDDSSFIVSGMTPGQVTFTFNPYADGKRVVRITHEGKDILQDGLDVEPGQVVEGVQIVIGAAEEADAKPDKQSDGKLRAQCTNNLKQMGVVLKMFINEQKTQTYPELSSVPGELMFSSEAKAFIQNGIVPEFITDTRIFVCPATEEAGRLDRPEVKADIKLLVSDRSYIYLGYAVTSDAEVKAFADAYRAQIAKGSPPVEDLPVAEGVQGSGGGNMLYRLRGGVERRIAKNANGDAAAARLAAQIPVLIERPGHHETEGGNVLYLDGAVRWVSPGTWPMTTATFDALNEMASLAKK